MLKDLLVQIAFAQELIPCQDGTMADPVIGCIETPAAILSTKSDLLGIILKVADGIVTIAVAIAVAVIIYGGITYALSLGSNSKIRQAKNLLLWSVFGLVVALLAKYIVAAILVLITQ
ncbi:MAG: hypothetical protein OEY44_02925 [Candidatus Peregrinibacteria bacterium]|nr:hypothetical protein [Candidatus Peregrinibacteria bacterium]